MNIEISEQEAIFLKQYAKVYDAERELDCTRKPIVVVEDEENVVTEAGYEDKIIYVWDESKYYNKADLIDDLREQNDFSDEEILNIAIEMDETGEALSGSVKVLPVQVIYKPIAYFLTRIEAEKYCEYQKHNLRRPRVYSRYVGYGNYGDMENLMRLLLKMGQQLNHEESEELKYFKKEEKIYE